VEFPKLRPVPDRIQVWDGYRGNLTLGWLLVYGKKGRSFETFGTYCEQCGQSWGWSPDREQVERLYKAMKRLGCPKCKKKS
jgi:hypothetical protein